MKKKMLTVLAISLFSLSVFGTSFAAKRTSTPTPVVNIVRFSN